MIVCVCVHVPEIAVYMCVCMCMCVCARARTYWNPCQQKSVLSGWLFPARKMWFSYCCTGPLIVGNVGSSGVYSANQCVGYHECVLVGGWGSYVYKSKVEISHVVQSYSGE